MSLDYLSNGKNKGLDITPNPNSLQNSGYSLDTRDYSQLTLNRSSSILGSRDLDTSPNRETILNRLGSWGRNLASNFIPSNNTDVNNSVNSEATNSSIHRTPTIANSQNLVANTAQVNLQQAAPTILQVNTTNDTNDGSANNGLSLRDAILIANANSNTEYEIHLTGGSTYNLTAEGIDEDAGSTGDLDITTRNNVLYITTENGQKATINASNLFNRDRVFDVLNGGQLSLQNVLVTGGAPVTAGSNGGGIRVINNGFLDLYNSIVSSNIASSIFSDGGGIHNDGSLYLRNGSMVSNNSAVIGGGIFNVGTLIAVNSTINNNSDGGGIYNYSGSMTLINTTVNNNYDQYSNGGISIENGSVALLNTTVSGNFGGGISAGASGVLNLINSTVTNNTVNSYIYGDGKGGGISQFRATVNLKNTIVAGNFNTNGDRSDLVGAFNGNNNNLIGSLTGASGTVGTGTDIVNPNPGLGPLQNNGGLTLTHALLPGSPAINAGNNSLIPADTEDLDSDGNTSESLPYDQRGLTRIASGTVDIGAFETQAATLTPTITVTASDSNAAETLSGQPTNPGVYTFTRTGGTTNPLTVKYALSGTATNGVDYNNLGTSIVIPVGQSNITLTLNPIDDNLVEGNKTAILTLASDSAYTIGNANNATITIADNDSNVSFTPNDFNSDGKRDLVWRNYATGQNATWFMNGTTFTGAQLLQSTSDLNWHIEGTGDFNNDGKSDLVWRNYATGENAVWFMNGTTFTGAQLLQSTPDLNWHIEGNGDFNNDGKSDLVWRNYATGQNAVWFMNGTTFTGAQLLQSTPDLNWHIEGTGDFNNDSRPDLVWRNYATGQNAIWFMNGTTLTSGQLIQSVGDTNWHIQGAGDFNNDSKPDLVWRNYATGENAMWLMNGTTLSGSQFLQAVGDINWQIVGT
jgi:CSLREA domain-containing protein